MPRLSKQRCNKILALTPDWMVGKITTYRVMKEVHLKDSRSAKKYLNLYAGLIREKEKELMKKLTNTEDNGNNTTIWQKIKTRILSRILTVQSAIQTQK